MRLSLTLLGFLVAAAGLSAPRANAATNRPVTLNDCFQMALERNLDIRITRYSPLFAANDLRVALAAYEPNFAISGAHNFSLVGGSLDANKLPTPASESDANSFTTSLGGTVPVSGMSYSLFGNVTETYGQTAAGAFDTSSGRVGVNLTQPLLKNFLFDTPRMTIAVSRNRLKFNESLLRAQIINTITAVELAYYDLIFAQESVKVQQNALELAERLLSENKKRVEVGALAPLDEKQSESQVAARRADLITATATLSTARNALKKLLTDNYTSIYDTTLEPADALSPAPQTLDLQESWRKSLALRPDLQQARLNVEEFMVQQRFYRNQLLPELDVFGTYGHGASGATTVEFADAFGNFRSGNRPFYTYGASLSIPLGNTVGRTRYLNSKLVVEQGQMILRKLEQDIMVQVDDAVGDVRRNFERIESTRQARLYAEAALDAEQKKLQNGKSTSFIVLQLQRDLTAARSEEIRALSDYNKSLAQLAQNEGSTLDRRNIDVQVK